MATNTATTAPATTAPATTAPATTVTAIVATVLNTVVAFARYHTRGAVAMVSYRLQGVNGMGILFAHAAQFGAAPPQTLAFTVPAIGTVVPAGSTLVTLRGSCVAGTRAVYGALGCPGMVVHGTMLPTPWPTSMVVNAVLTATPSKAGKATSAVVAAGNVAQATKAQTPVAVPATVAAVAGTITAAIVAATPVANTVRAAGNTAPGKTAAQRKANGKHVA